MVRTSCVARNGSAGLGNTFILYIKESLGSRNELNTYCYMICICFCLIYISMLLMDKCMILQVQSSIDPIRSDQSHRLWFVFVNATACFCLCFAFHAHTGSPYSSKRSRSTYGHILSNCGIRLCAYYGGRRRQSTRSITRYVSTSTSQSSTDHL